MKPIRRGFLLSLMVLLVAGCGRGSEPARPSGTLEATETDIASAMAGRVLVVNRALGERVNTGDTLLVLDTELLQLQRAQTAATAASLDAQRRVAGDGLNQAKRNLDLAETTLSRIRALVEQGSATQQQLDEQQAKRDVALAQVSAARNQLDVLQAEQAKLQATLAVMDRQLKDGVVTSPVNGTVILRSIEPGEMVMPNSVLMRLADLSRLELRVFLGEEDLDRVKVGQEFPVYVDALKGETLKGTVTWVSSEAEFTPKNVQTRQARTQLVYAVKLSVANPDGRLHIGMPAEIEIGQVRP